MLRMVIRSIVEAASGLDNAPVQRGVPRINSLG
jgi:hypothetical protein